MLAMGQERLAAFPASAFVLASFTSDDWTSRVAAAAFDERLALRHDDVRWWRRSRRRRGHCDWRRV
jgi:hypothetical protein